MTTSSKIIIGIAAVVLLFVALIVVGLAGFGIYLNSDKEGTKLYHDAVVEGPEFGKTTDQNGCLTQGLARLKGVADPTINQLSANGVFISGCFETAKQSTDFCTNVPSIPYIDWVDSECRKLGKDNAACRGVMNAKHGFCNGL